MVASGDVLALTVIAIITTVTLGQECSVNVCAQGERCFNRNVPGEPPYICECLDTRLIGYDCSTPSPVPISEITTCYGLECRSGTFSSPGYPLPYPPRYAGVYLIYVPGATSFTFSFSEQFGIETIKDELYFGAGVDFSLDQLNGNTIENEQHFFNGTVVPADFTIDSDVIWIGFITDKNVQLDGWEVSWTTEGDTTGPTVSNPPGDITSTVELPATTVPVTWPELIATDPSTPVDLIFQSNMPGDAFPVGTTPVTYIFQDAAGNPTTLTFNVIVTQGDMTGPTITTSPGDITATTPPGSNTVPVSWTPPTATDPSTPVTIIFQSHTPGDAFPVGTTPVTYIFQDGAGNPTSVTFDVIVTQGATDTTGPTITSSPGDITATTPPGSDTVPVTWTPPTATDPSLPVIVVFQSHVPGNTFPVGTTPVTYIFQDAAGNPTSVTFNVIVSPGDDNTPPTIDNCPADIARNVSPGVTSIPVVWAEPTAMDASGTVSPVLQTHMSGEDFPVGATTVTYFYTDGSNNNAFCQFTVTVTIGEPDTTGPTIVTLPGDVTGTLGPSEVTVPVFWTEPTVTDPSLPVTIVYQSHSPGDSFPMGITPITYIFQDAAGNPTTVTFNAIVTPTGADTMGPTITRSPGDVTATVELGSPTNMVPVTWTPPTATDPSGPVSVVFQSHTPGDTFPVGTTPVTYIFQDALGNPTTVTFNVIVTPTDNTPPTVEDVPDVVAMVEMGTATTPVFWTEPTATDASGPVSIVSQSHTPGATFPVGTTPVTYVFEDSSGNQETITFDVVVQPTEDGTTPPTVGCPTDIERTVLPGVTSLAVEWSEPMAADDSGTVNLVLQTHVPGQDFSVGPTTVTYVYVDDSNSNAICQFTVTVTVDDSDTTGPTITSPTTDVTATTPPGSNTVPVTWTPPTATDPSSPVNVVFQSHMPGDTFPVGTTPVTYIFQDAAGNPTTVTFDVIVTPGGGDNIGPTIVSPLDDITATLDPGMITIPVTWTEPTATDPSSPVTIAYQSHSPGDEFPPGTTPVTYIFQDAAGNPTTVSFNVIVASDDATGPTVINPPGDITATVQPPATTVPVTWPELIATDPSTPVNLIFQSHMPGDAFPVGTTPVMYIFQDSAGNPTTVTFNVIVTEGDDNTPPAIENCPTDITRFVSPGVTSLPVEWTKPTAMDASGTVNLVLQTHMSGQGFQIGATTVTYFYTDDSGNNAFCQFTVTVAVGEPDTTGPTIISLPSDLTATIRPDTTSVPVFWTPPTATDPSLPVTIVFQSHSPGDQFPLGVTPVTYIFEDSAGNPTTGTFNVIVTPTGADNMGPMITSSPGDITETVELGSPTTAIPVTWTPPTATDPSSPVSVVFQSHMPGDTFPVGTTPVTYIFQEALGNQTPVTFDVIVTPIDTTEPTVEEVPDVMATVGTGITTTPVSWTAPTATDNSGLVSIVSQTHSPGDAFPIGTTPVTYIFEDPSGNQETVTFNVVVAPTEDGTTPPTIGCPSDIERTVGPGVTSLPVEWPEPIAVDDSGIVSLQFRTHAPGSNFRIGSTTVTYLFIDDSSNNAICQFAVIVTVDDTTGPTIITSPGDTTATTPPGSNTAPVTWTPPTATDPSLPVDVVFQSHMPGDTFPVGTTPVTYIFEDAAGNPTSVTFDVIVTPGGDDNTGPTIVSPLEDITAIIDPDMNTIPMTWTEPTATDPTGPVNLIYQSHSPGDEFPLGTTPVTYIFQDAAGNPTTATFDVIVTSEVVDTTGPTIIRSPGDVTATIDTSSPLNSVPVTWPEPIATDPSEPVTIVFQSHNSGNQFPIGTTPVTYIFQDAVGNQTPLTFNVIVTPVDTTGPTVLNPPGDIASTVELPATTVPVSWPELIATDPSTPVNLIFQSHTPGDAFPVGATPVTYIFQDGAGNPTSVTFDVIVAPVDSTPPAISNCPEPGSITRTIELGSTEVPVGWVEPTATDFGGDVTVEQSHVPPATFGPGVTPVTYTFTDIAGNNALCIFTVTVMQVDTQPPVISDCPTDPIAEIVEIGTTLVPVTWVEPTATDLSGPVSVMRSATPGTPFPVGPTTVTYTFTDGSGIVAACEFDVTVITVDTTPPTIENCPDNIMDVTELGTPGKIIAWAEPTAVDISGEATLVQRSREPGMLFEVGGTTVVYTFIDSSGNTADCMFTVSIITEDTTPPTISNCPEDIDISIELGVMNAIATWAEPTATDLSGRVTVVTQTAQSGTSFPLGTMVVFYIFGDEAGNNDICSFEVRVMNVDTTPPVISDCPESKEEFVELGLTGRVVSWMEPSATDLSGSATVMSQSHSPGDQFPVGSTVVNYVFVDASEITAMCSFVVTVIPTDSTPPVISNCPSDIVEIVELGIVETPVSWTLPTATDLSGMVAVVRSHVPGTPFEVGPTTVTYTFSDMSGNPATCQFVVTVIPDDTTPPLIQNCPGSLMDVTELGTPGAVISWDVPTAVDISGPVMLVSQTHFPNRLFLVGETEVVYIFSDSSDNRATCSFIVAVTTEDTTPPTISDCPDDIVRDIELGLQMTPVFWVPPTASDISQVAVLIAQTAQPGDLFPVGPTGVSYVFSDGASNTDICSFDVIVREVDTTAPTVVTVPEDLTVTVELGTTDMVPVIWEPPTAVDASGPTTVSSSHSPGEMFPIGTTPVTYTFQDSTGNPTTVTFNVVVVPVDTTAPTVVTVPEDLTVTVELGTTDMVPVTWEPPTAVDASGPTTVSSSHSPGEMFPIGTTPVTYTFQDSTGNPTTVTFNVVVVPVDTTAPTVVTVPEDLTVTVELGTTDMVPVTWEPPTAVDASGPTTVSSSHSPGEMFPIGTTPVTYTFQDSTGNPTTVTFNVVVVPVDTTPPTVINPPEDVTTTLELPATMRPVEWTEPIATDISPPIDTVFQSHMPGDTFPVGTTPVTYIFQDAEGNPVTITFNVIVTPVDTTGPTVVDPPDVSTTAEIPAMMVPVVWPEPTVMDPSGPVSVVFQSHMPGDTFPVGTTPVTYIFQDAVGNPTTVTFDVVVTPTDTTPPTVDNIPPAVPVTVELGSSSTPVIWMEPMATDVSGPVSIVSQSHSPGDSFPIGTTPVTYVFEDSSGNQATVTFNVVVASVDTTSPTIENVPATIPITVELGMTRGPATWEPPTATDLSGIPTLISQSHTPGSNFPLGVTEVMYVFVDSSGNMATATFDVVVTAVDTTPPVIVQCPNDIVRTTLVNVGGTIVSWPTPTAVDVSGTAVITSESPESGSFFLTGATEVTITFSDASGNSADCIFDVFVVEANPCDPNPCTNGATCVATTQTDFICVCPDTCYTGELCEIALSACTDNQCSNGAICRTVEGSCTQYTCECPPCFTGPFCNIPLDACFNNQCQNGAQCVQDGSCTSYRCECPACFTGEFCEQAYNVCDDSSCLNGGVCTTIGSSCTEYTCSCPSCFTGAYCEIAKEACQPDPCLNQGLCIGSFDDSCFAYSCQCVGCYTGFNCEIAITPACASSPCVNGGVCTNIPGTCSGFSCDCPIGFSGVRCEVATASNINPCNSSPCDNGATCLVMDGRYYICVCRPGYAGVNCGYTTMDSAVGIDPCASVPCLNGASCRASYNSLSSPQGTYVPQYTCICQAGTTGGNCQLTTAAVPTLDVCNLDNRPDCDNGGTCANAYHSYDQDVDYYCFCPAGFVGHNCDIMVADPCASNPCQNGGACFSFNTYYTCTCPTGYSGTTCEDITASDSTGPTLINCPTAPITVTIPTGTQGTVTWPELFAFDASGPVELIYQSHESGTLFPLGSTTIAFVYIDTFRNPSVCTFIAIVSSEQPGGDTTPPVIMGCPTSDVTAVLPGGTTSTPVSWVEPVAMDESQVQPTRTRSHTPGSPFSEGRTTVTYIFTDTAGNPAICTFDVVVSPQQIDDNTPPVITGCPTDDITAVLPQGAGTTSVSWVEPVATDNSLVEPTQISSRIPGSSFLEGTTVVTYIFTDAANNVAFCTFNVVVSPASTTTNQPPVIMGCPEDIVVNIPAGEQLGMTSWTVPTATDDSGPATLVSGPSINSGLFPLGTTTINYIFKDITDLQSSCWFAITVMSGSVPDNTPPVISDCPGDIQLSMGVTMSASVSWRTPTATDDSGGQVTVTGPPSPSGLFPVDQTSTVTYTFTDPSGNEAVCAFNIIISSGGPVDTEDPVVSGCPGDIFRQIPNTETSTTISWVPPMATDNLDTSLTVEQTHTPGDTFPVGATLVQYTFTDDAGRSAMCSFTVNIFVSGIVVDTTPPTISDCPSVIVVTAPSGSPTATATWVPPTATDASGIDSVVPTAIPGQAFPTGITTVSYTFTDTFGNEAVCSFQIVVISGGPVDTEDPVVSGCPGDIFRQIPNTETSTPVSWVPPMAIDNLDTSLSVEQTHTPGDTFPVGATLVQYTFTDDAGRSALCSFTVNIFVSGIVADTTPPIVSDCPVDPILRIISSTLTSGTVSWTPDPSATDESGTVRVSTTHANGGEFPEGTTEVTYTFSDAFGNEAACSFDVVVQRGTYPCAGTPCPPELSCFYSPSQFICRPRVQTRRRRSVRSIDNASCPCQNGGSCREDDGLDGLYCACPPGVSGVLCELRV